MTPATASTLGGIKIGDTLSINDNNVANAIGIKNTNTANGVPNPVKIWQGNFTQFVAQKQANTIAATDICVVTNVETADDYGSITEIADNLFNQDYGSITESVTPINRASIVIGNSVVGQDIMTTEQA